MRSIIQLAVPVSLAVIALFSTSVADARVADARVDDATPQVIEIHAKKFGYQPEEITLHKGQAYKLHLTSDDVPHSLRIAPLDVNAVMKPGAFNDVLVTPAQPGEYRGDCGVFCGPGHKKMFLSVHVVE